MIVKQLTDPKALMRPEVEAILRKAIASGVLLAPYGFEQLAPELLDFIIDENHFLILGAEKGDFHAVAMGYFNTGYLFPYPTIVLFYNDGSAALRKELSKKILDTIAARGYTNALAVNGSGHPDHIWAKALLPEGATAEPVGSFMMIKV